MADQATMDQRFGVGNLGIGGKVPRFQHIVGTIGDGSFSTSNPIFSEAAESERKSRELSRERARQNAFMKAIRLGKFGQRSLLSGSFAGITNEAAAASALGGTRPGFTVAASAAAPSAVGGGGGVGGGGRTQRYRGLIP